MKLTILSSSNSLLLGLFGVLLLASHASALSMSYVFRSHEPRICFYIDVPHVANSINLYFALSETGENAGTVDMTFYGPHGSILHTLRRQSHNELKIRPNEAGEHSVCFSHSTTYTDKDIDLDVSLTKLDSHPDLMKAEPPKDPAGQLAKKLEKTGEDLQRDLTELLHTLRHLRNRERRGLETVESISGHIYWFSLLEMALIIGMSVLQVVILRTFFSSTGKTRV